jgi:hypothetical protein
VAFLGGIAYLLDRRAKVKGALLTGSSSPGTKIEGNIVSPEQIALIKQNLKIENQLKGGANGFFWIAGLSLINSVIFLVGGTWVFFIGLGITQFVDGISMAIAADMESNVETIVRIVAFAVDIGIAGIFVVFGILARKRYKWVFIVGMILYALDGLIFLIVPDFLSIGFHIFILFGIYGGLKAIGTLQKIERASVPAI